MGRSTFSMRERAPCRPDGGGSGRRQAAAPSCCDGGFTEPDDLLVLCGEPGQGLGAEVRELIDLLRGLSLRACRESRCSFPS